MVCNILDMFINILRLRVVIRTASIVRPEVDAYNVRRAWLAGQLILRAPLLNHMAKVSTAKLNL